MSNLEWVQEDNRYFLYFTPFYDALLMADIMQDEDEDWIYSSDIAHADCKILEYSNTLDEAKKSSRRNNL